MSNNIELVENVLSIVTIKVNSKNLTRRIFDQLPTIKSVNLLEWVDEDVEWEDGKEWVSSPPYPLFDKCMNAPSPVVRDDISFWGYVLLGDEWRTYLVEYNDKLYTSTFFNRNNKITEEVVMNWFSKNIRREEFTPKIMEYANSIQRLNGFLSHCEQIFLI